MPKVSVIIPVYNTENYINRCLESVCSQTLSDIEIICVNDASPDNSLQLLEEWSKKDNRIKVINFDSNKGVATVKNTALDAASGEYIGFVDSDDYIDSNFYEKLYLKSQQTNADMVKGYLRFVDWDKPEPLSYKNLEFVQKNKLRFIHTPTAIFRREFLNKYNIRFPEGLKCAEDSVFEVKAAAHTNTIEIEPSVNYYYCYRTNSLNHIEKVDIETLKDIEKTLLMIVEILDSLDLDIETYIDSMKERENYLEYYCKDKEVDEECLNYAKAVSLRLLKHSKRGMEIKRYKLLNRTKNSWQKAYSYAHMERINKEQIDNDIKNCTKLGITETKREQKFIVSLTSFPPRMCDIHYAIWSLLDQTVKPDEIILWLGEDKFLNKEQDLPESLLNLKKFGLTIKFTKDIRSYTKLIPSLKEFPDAVIVTADDDIYYARDWFEKLYNAYQEDKEHILCHRAHRVRFNSNGKISPYNTWQSAIVTDDVSYLNFLTGVGGVLYPPNILYKDVFDEEKFKRLSPMADDIWFWAMAVLNNVRLKVIKNPYNKLQYVNPERELGQTGEPTLQSQNVGESKNDTQLQAIIEEYPQLYDMLYQEKEQLVNV